MKICILTLGCKVNQSESADMESDFFARGCNIVDLQGKPDYCIVNTCSVTSKSDYQSRQLIRRAHRSGAKVIVTGCYSELNKNLFDASEVGATVVENRDKRGIGQALAGGSSQVTPDYNSYGKSRFFLKVQDGCDNTCTYCVIPRSRGVSTSVSKEEIIARINRISSHFSEVVLTGIHLGAYGYDHVPNVSLSVLIGDILYGTDIGRIRLSSLEVNEVGADLLDVFEDKRICRHLHIPLQSGDDEVLRRMNRKYTVREFADKINAIYERYPGISIGTDVIVGFPGENKKAFENTRDLLISLPLSYMHIFSYSRRPYTAAWEMQDDIAPSVKKTRAEMLRSIDARKRAEYMKLQVGKALDVLIEKVLDEDRVIGLSANYLRVAARANHKQPARTIAAVRIMGVEGKLLRGALIHQP